MVINLALISLGIAYSWIRYRWVGLIPIFCFVIYDLGISIPLTSGGRYPVPINWIFFFYFGLGILALLFFVLERLGFQNKHSSELATEEIKHSRTSNPMVLSIVGLVILGSLIPLANFGLPLIIHKSVSPSAENTLLLNGIDQLPDIKYLSGKILYPYNPKIDKNTDSDYFSFTFLHDNQAKKYRIIQNQETQPIVGINDGEDVIIGIDSENQVQIIFVSQDGKLQVIWER